MRKASYLHLLEDLATIAAPEETKRQFEELIRRSALLDGVTSLGRPERVKYARHLLELREPRSVISRRLMARYKIGRTQSYQVISDALQLSGFQPENRTDTASNAVSNIPTAAQQQQVDASLNIPQHSRTGSK